MYNLPLDQLMLRYYFMMAVVIGSFYLGMPWLSILAVPILLSALAGWKFSLPKRKPTHSNTTRKTRSPGSLTGQHV